ncbi:MAG: DUF1640 domain-containing protein, partial [Synergistaceae bacterium]|nr:DUF1640 domain-containing protein [Synergistaceae bacterium]MBR0044426.1 DUF1640 domain-containing protein [Synergistaceae bacterium]MBR0222280.1 DUF1640 domain-containing protein [Synergistaceae bacterium]
MNEASKNDEYVRKDVFDARMDRLETIIRESNARIENKIDSVEQKLNAKIDGVEQKLNAKIDGVEQKLNARIDGVEQKLNARIDGVEQKLDKVATELRAEIMVNSARIEGVQTSVYWCFSAIAIIAALVALVPKMSGMFKGFSLRSSSLTVDEIKAIVDDAVKQALKVQNS